MKKKSRRPRPSKTQTTVSVIEEKRPPGSRGRPRKTVPVTTNSFHYNAAEHKTANFDFSVTAADNTQKHPESKTKSSGEC